MNTPHGITQRLSQVISFAVVALCSAALVGPAWGQKAPAPPESSERKLSRVVVSDTNPNHKAHVFFSYPTEKKFRAQAHTPSPGFSGPTNTNLNYTAGNGPVMRNPTNYLIFWQPPNNPSTFPAGYQAGIEAYFQNVGGTPFYNIVTQYNDTSGVPVPNSESLGAPAFTDTTTLPPSGNDGTGTSAGTCPACPLTDGDIQNEVTVALAANPQWQSPGINVEYFVFLPPNVSECFNSTSCFALNSDPNGQFCAYHTYFNGNTIYAFMPFAASGSCYGDATTYPNIVHYPNGQNIDIEVSPVSHEMIESNTDPLLNAWQGTNGLSDEIGDKCAYNYGYVAPDGTNFVLNGNRFQIQQEWSNDAVACTKRYGPEPVTANAGPLAFGEVQAGNSAQQGVQIQNNGAGDLNILDIALGSSSAYFTLMNPQPTAATLHSSESLTANVQFAPAFGSSFSSPTDTLVVDTDETPYNGSTTFASIGGIVGVPPDALCQTATVPTDPNLCTTAVASINNSSYDPDGESVTLIQSPAGPYTLGSTPVTLTVTDTGPDHARASCIAPVIVQDHQPPTITCPAPKTVQCTSSSGAAVSLHPTVFDNCPGVTASCVPSSGSTFGFGTTPVTCSALDASGNVSSPNCSTSVTVAGVPPVIASVVASPAVLSPSNKKLVPVTITVKDSDTCDPSPSCSITSVTANKSIPASYIHITGPLTVNLANAGTGGHPLTYIVTVTCTPAHGGSTSAQTSVTSN